MLAPPAGPAPLWVDGATWIVAVDYDSGRRVVFGRGGAPAVPLPDAVVASCSIPGWYRPAAPRSPARASWPRCAADHPSRAREGPGPAKIGGCG